MTASKVLFFCCLSFIFGIFVASFFNFSFPVLFLVLILALFLISIFSKYQNFLVAGICLLFFVLGIWRYQSYLSKVKSQEIKNFIGKEISIFGIIDEEPRIKEKTIIFSVMTEKGKILVKTGRYPEFEYGEKIKITGILKEPESFSGFDYKNYLLKNGILVEIDFPKIEKLKENFGNPIKRELIHLKGKLKSSLKENLPVLHAGILEALLFGEEEDISNEWKEKLNKTGTRHIVAVSGMNITIVSFLVLNFLLFFGFWRKQAILLSLFLIFLYVLMIGAPVSAIRAAIMGTLLLIAQYLGRQSESSRIIFLAGAIMLFLNPLLLRYDIGFQLSFLATLGLIYLSPVFQEIFKKFPNFLEARNNLVSTLSAQAFAFPILLYNFGQFSLISPLPNILILWLLPFLTIFGFVFSFLGIFSKTLGYLLSFPAWLFLSFILKVIDFFSKIPFSSINLKINPIFLFLSYLILLSLTFYFQRKINQPIFLR
jgi:competence protein ComEC